MGVLKEGVILIGILQILTSSAFPNNAVDRSSKDNGFSGEYESRLLPYKAYIDLLRIPGDFHNKLEVSHNKVDNMDDEAYTEYLSLDPTLRSRRRRRQVQLGGQHPQQVIRPLSSSATNVQQPHVVCLPHFTNINPLCQQFQMFFGMPSNTHSNLHVFGQPTTSALGGSPPASSAILLSHSPSFVAGSVPPTSSISSSHLHQSNSNALVQNQNPLQHFFGTAAIDGRPSSLLSRNEIAVMNYYQQQFPHLQVPPVPVQEQAFQGPMPDERQRQQYENIHQKYPYPYPPTLDVDGNPIPPPQGEVPQSGGEHQSSDQSSPAVSTTDYPSDASSGAPDEAPAQSDSPPPPPSSGYIPDSPYGEQSISSPPPNSADPSSSAAVPPGYVPSSPASQQTNYPQPQEIQQITQALKQELREREEENRRLRQQVEQAGLQIVAYEQETAAYKEYKDQYQRAEEANVKLRDRVLQLENTNQHLQEQYGQLQQQNSEQRQQINGLKDSQKELMTQIENYQSQMTPLNKEIQNHRKEIEDFLIRIRKLGEENDTCKKQVKLYQLKISYIQEQQQQKEQKTQQTVPAAAAVAPAPVAAVPPPAPAASVPKSPQASQKKQPQSQQRPVPIIVVTHNDDDELDPELQRMDAEIDALQEKSDAIAASIRNLPQPPQTTLSLVSVTPSEIKAHHEFRGEAVQVNPDSARAPSASRTMPSWEKPKGF